VRLMVDRQADLSHCWARPVNCNLTASFMRALVFCTTCRFSRDEQVGPDGRTGGETLIAEMEALLRSRGRSDVNIERQACLWSCLRHCNLVFRDDQRFSYIAGDFRPERQAAEAILEWFDLHGKSEAGTVPFRDWPRAMRGHFIARIPPAKA
jgi:predicted metal-binding protein